jgi:hypothetical protein
MIIDSMDIIHIEKEKILTIQLPSSAEKNYWYEKIKILIRENKEEGCILPRELHTPKDAPLKQKMIGILKTLYIEACDTIEEMEWKTKNSRSYKDNVSIVEQVSQLQRQNELLTKQLEEKSNALEKETVAGRDLLHILEEERKSKQMLKQKNKKLKNELEGMKRKVIFFLY